ncbi:glycosyltransferase family protein [Candidatus Pelagibacter sp.]|nr:glycosyltransferase family protein [Candidatus Pelagibacter sp.]
MINFGAIIEARLGSTRLPGKVMLKVNNQPLIFQLIKRLKFVKNIDQIIVATTLNKKDDVICDFLKKNKINFFRGSEDNVVDRVLKAAKKFKIKNIVQVTGDCPLIDPYIVSQVIETFKSNNFDFVSNANIRTYPDGMDVSIFSTKNLNKLSKLTKNKFDLEHVTLYFRRKKNIFSHCNIMAPLNLHYPKLGLTLDEKNDYHLIKVIFKKFRKFRKPFTCLQIIEFLKKNPHFLMINKKVKRNVLPLALK